MGEQKCKGITKEPRTLQATTTIVEAIEMECTVSGSKILTESLKEKDIYKTQKPDFKIKTQLLILRETIMKAKK